MLQVIFSLLKRLGRPDRTLQGADLETQWLRDPLSHPDLQRMSPRELADLPLGAWARTQA